MNLILKNLIVAVLSCSTCFASDVPKQAGTAALVNGVAISEREFRGELSRLLRLRKKTEQELSPETLALTKKEALETLVGRELLYRQSQLDGVIIQDSDVDAEIETLRKRYPGEEDFIASLEKLGLNRNDLVSQISRGMAIQALTDARFGAKTVVTDAEVRSYYERHLDDFMQPERIRLSHILVKPGTLVSASGSMPARTKIEALRRRISRGEDFAIVARESDDSTSSPVGGDLGYFTPGQLGKGLESTAFSLDAGQVSAVVEDSFGYHILKVAERRPKTAIPFEDVRGKISRQLKQERLLGEMAPFLKRLRKEARVEIHLPGE